MFSQRSLPLIGIVAVALSNPVGAEGLHPLSDLAVDAWQADYMLRTATGRPISILAPGRRQGGGTRVGVELHIVYASPDTITAYRKDGHSQMVRSW